MTERMDRDAVFDTLVKSNPVPNPHSTRSTDPARVVPLRPAHTGSETMKTIQPVPDVAGPPRRPRRAWIVAAAAAAIVLVGIGALLISTADDGDNEPVDVPATTTAPTPPPTTEAPSATLGPADEPAAAAAAEAFYSNVVAGDVDAVVAMSNPRTDLVADRAMWEMNAYAYANGQAPTLDNCRTFATTPQIIEAGCDVTITDPVWKALGAPEQMILPIRFFADGTVQWLPFRVTEDDTSGFDLSRANRAVAQYLRERHPTEYDAGCSPVGYETGTINQDQGLALTVECAQLWVPLRDEIAAWVVETGFGT